MSGRTDSRYTLEGSYDDARYWERVSRNLGWMGETDEEARANQASLRDATIGIAGTGGIGGASAIRLVRMGARHIKIADPEDFEISNIQRQSGATIKNVGRNKASVVAELVLETSEDAVIEVFTDGLNDESAEQFVEGCDVVTDQIEVYEIDAKYALHRAFRSSERTKVLYSIATIGHGALVHKYTSESPPIEEIYGIPEGTPMDAAVAAKLVTGQVPEEMLPSWPSKETRRSRYSIGRQIAPIFGPTPAFCEGVLVWLVCRELMDLPSAIELPARPGYAWIDMWSWSSKIVPAVDVASPPAAADAAVAGNRAS